LCGELPAASFIHRTGEIAHLMVSADLSIGGCGTASWERAMMGLPAVVIVLADNQARIAEALASAGAVVNLGRSEKITAQNVKLAAEDLLRDPAKVRSMGVAARRIMKDEGYMGASGVVDVMMEDVRAVA
jgi:UDP-2,4-diacetamido-2,4,6-trideoxy-beta-L-altropyranose hydrolase